MYMQATEQGIWVSNIPSSSTGNALSCAEHAIYLMLASLRQQNAMRASIQHRRVGVPVGETLFNKCVLIVGFGNIAKELIPRQGYVCIQHAGIGICHLLTRHAAAVQGLLNRADRVVAEIHFAFNISCSEAAAHVHACKLANSGTSNPPSPSGKTIDYIVQVAAFAAQCRHQVSSGQ